jgi:acetyl esterase/lipase
VADATRTTWADIVLEEELRTDHPARPGHDKASLIAAFPELGSVTTRSPEIAGPNGPVASRLYLPESAVAGVALVWAHGGAYIFGDLDMPESNWVGLAIAARGIPVLCLDYRKALNGNHHPVLSDDVLAGWTWASEHADALGVAPDRLHLGGASAGANLVTGVALRLREAGRPLPRSLVLCYPTLHAELPEPSAELAATLAAWAAYDPALPGIARDVNLNHVGTEAGMVDPVAFPACANLAGLPPTYILNSELDGLRASAEAFAVQLAASDVLVRTEFEPGATHGQLNEPFLDVGQRSLARIAAWLLHQ